MAETPAADSSGRSMKRRLPLLAALALAPVAGAAGFYAVQSGLLSAPAADARLAPLTDVTFVPVPQIVLGLLRDGRQSHLQFAAQIEVAQGYGPEVEFMMPRIVDMLNSYLRAVDPAALEQPAALLQLRAQMRRRIQVLLGEDRVRDLLVTQFVIN